MWKQKCKSNAWLLILKVELLLTNLLWQNFKWPDDIFCEPTYIRKYSYKWNGILKCKLGIYVPRCYQCLTLGSSETVCSTDGAYRRNFHSLSKGQVCLLHCWMRITCIHFLMICQLKKNAQYESCELSFLGQNKDYSLRDSISDSSKELLWRWGGGWSVYMWFWWRAVHAISCTFLAEGCC